ncbi:sensor histidine kinase [Caulobacter sp. D5]|uniref:sensor histidine kinase n=2 Tax=unclassified Caulobacter TaxID=2648921 RepID=UPI001E5C339F|nr:HWE histidine kinase domain-containing protein [Caulobacter sp. D5]
MTQVDAATAAAGPPTVRRRLLIMALCLVAPAIVFMALLARAEYGQSRGRYEQQLVATTRALGLAVDRQLAQGQSTLQALSVSPALAAGDLESFERQARAAVGADAAWIVLISPRGQVVNTRLPPGQAPPRSAGLPPERWAAVRSGRTTVSNLTFGKVVKQPIVAIDMPVIVAGELYDLAYIQTPSAFAPLFAAQGVPHSWTASIVDRNAKLVARSRDQEKMLGRSASRPMLDAMARDNDGVLETYTLDGTPTLSAFSRSAAYGWTFIVGVPRAELERANLSSLALLVTAGLVLLAIGATAALLFSRGISREVRALVADARIMAAGGEMPAQTSGGLREIGEVREALHAASNQLRAREAGEKRAAARQQLMINELNHRVKNTLATVQSLALQSLGRGEAAPGFDAFNERLYALARAHDLLTRTVWESADLAEVVRQTLEPYGDRARCEGPPAALPPSAALALSMVFHELATNASKYGGLSTPNGRVEVTWRRDPLDPRHLALRWVESGGPKLDGPPQRKGFGSRLIAASLRSELKGEAVFEYLPTGLVCALSVRLPDPAGAQALGDEPSVFDA